MTFATQRAAALQAVAFSTTRGFAEIVTYKTRTAAASSITVKIEAENKPRRGQQMQPQALQQQDSVERIRVCVCRDTSQASGGMEDKPNIGDIIVRGESIDADQRAFVFTGEVVAFGPLTATYIFERARRQYDDRRHAQRT